jgi:hypothetical protein
LGNSPELFDNGLCIQLISADVAMGQNVPFLKQAQWLANLVTTVPTRKEQRALLLAFRNRLERRIEMVDARLAEVED